MSQRSSLKLSICITTLNRGAVIGGTLESILPQLTNECELVILDAASTDNTESIVSKFARRSDRLRYIKQNKNNGVDRDYDRVVELAQGEYCWLMSDDDLLKPGAVETVLRALRQDVSLVMVNVESKDFHMAKVLHPRWVDVEADRLYEPDELDRLFVDADLIVRYIGCVIIRRAIWLAREKQRYFDTCWAYVGVIFQERLPGKAILIAEPLVSYRMSNSHAQAFTSGFVSELLFTIWPSLVGSLALSKAAIGKIQSAEPWKHLEWLLFLRALNLYSVSEYRRLVRPRLHSVHEKWTPVLAAWCPAVLANAVLVLYYSLRPRGTNLPWNLHFLRDSRSYFRHWPVFRRPS